MSGTGLALQWYGKGYKAALERLLLLLEKEREEWAHIESAEQALTAACTIVQSQLRVAPFKG